MANRSAQAQKTGAGVKKAPSTKRYTLLSKKTKEELQKFFKTIQQEGDKEEEEDKKEIQALEESVAEKINQHVKIDCIDLFEIETEISRL